MAAILPAFDRHPKEGEIIGRIVVGYGELEFELALCATWVIRDRDVAFKVMYRGRGESQRVSMADALMRPMLKEPEFKSFYEHTIADVRHCLKIRNEYAHCNWFDHPDHGLMFVALEQVADDNGPYDISKLKQHPLPLPHLEAQWAFFENVGDRLSYINHEAQGLAGVRSIPPNPKPAILAQPPVRIDLPAPGNPVPLANPTPPPR
jgi:hypothetical protein